MEATPKIDLNALADFLDEANKNTFANKNAKKVASIRPSSSDYHWENGDWVYHDTYFGNHDFIGEEVAYYKQKPVWGMNYYGVILSDDVSEKELGSFLEDSIMQKYDDIIPVRGPKEYSRDAWHYKLSVEGELGCFSGKEEILYDGKVVYRLYLQGGLIK